MGFRNKAYDKLESLSARWGISLDDICYAIENGLLRACVWMPLRCLEFCVSRRGRLIVIKHENLEGFMALRSQDFRLVCGNGSAKLRTFRSVDDKNYIIRLTYEPPQPPLCVRIQDVVVLQADQEAFEQRYQLSTVGMMHPQRPPDDSRFIHFHDYRHVQLAHHRFQLGDVQARIVRHLHEAAVKNQPWVHGKILIDVAGSHAVRMRDIFKHKKNWRQLILSDDRGYYRLNWLTEEWHDQPPERAEQPQRHKQNEKELAGDPR